MSRPEMQAVVVEKTGKQGDWNRLALAVVEKPALTPGTVLVQVEACSVNRADLLQRRGFYPPPPGASSILGLDFAGLVTETTVGVSEWKPGDRVFGITAGGGYGRYAVVQADHLVHIPKNLSFIEAAAAAEVFFTAFHNLFLEADLQTRETLLIHGGGSGVGTASIQLAKTRGAEVIVTAGSTDKIQQCLELGADYGINYKTEDFAARVLEITQGRGVDVILDWIGASYLARHLTLLRTKGRLIVIGLMGGHTAEIALATLLTKRLRVIGSVLRSQSNEEKAVLAEGFRQQVVPLLDNGHVRPIIDRIYPMEDAEAAHQYLREGRHFGKIVLTWSKSQESRA